MVTIISGMVTTNSGLVTTMVTSNSCLLTTMVTTNSGLVTTMVSAEVSVSGGIAVFFREGGLKGATSRIALCLKTRQKNSGHTVGTQWAHSGHTVGTAVGTVVGKVSPCAVAHWAHSGPLHITPERFINWGLRHGGFRITAEGPMGRI